MTLFTGKSPASTEADASQDQGGEIDYVAHYTKDGKAPDLAEISKGKYHADMHITRLEKEQAELRKELDKRLTYEELMAKIETVKSPTSKPERVERTEDEQIEKTPNSNSLDLAKVEEIMRKTYQQESVKASQQRNIEQVKDVLTKTWGAGFERSLEQKANDLGVTKEYMDNLAATSPKAFLTLVGVTEAVRPSVAGSLPPPTRVEGRSDGGKSNVKNMAYYNKMMTDNPREYWTPRVQNEIHEMARTMGDAFYK